MTDERDCLAFCGDVMLGRLVNDRIAGEHFAYPWGDLLPYLREADLFLINLECAMTDRGQCWSDGRYKPFSFRAGPAVVATLQAGRVDCASLANNHACDYGTEGLLQTIDVLDSAGIAHVGAGRDLLQARRAVLLEMGHRRVAVLGIADYPAAWAAGADTAGINYVPISVNGESFETLRHAITAVRRQSDIVVLSAHWGPNMRDRPTATFRDFARATIDAGVTIFWGHSAHIVQGIEFHGTGLILYDTGDFIDDYAVDAMLRNDLSALFIVTFDDSGIAHVRLLPVRIDDMQVNAAKPDDSRRFAELLAPRCGEMGTELRSVRDTPFFEVRRAETIRRRPARMPSSRRTSRRSSHP